MSSRFDRAIAKVQRLLVLGPGHRAPLTPSASRRPDDPRPSSTRVRWLGAVAAVAVPIAFAGALVAVREPLERSLSLLMVIPVLGFALVGGARLAIVSAVVGALAFDVFHTVPYYSFDIDQSAYIVEMVILLGVGVLTGLIASTAQRALAGAGVRLRELEAFTEFLEHIRPNEPERMIEQGRSSIEHVLLAASCTWRPGYRGTAAPTLQPSGTIVATNALLAHGLDDRRLPSQIEIPVGVPPNEHGRMTVHSVGAETSIEERRTAVAIASALGRLLDHPVA